MLKTAARYSLLLVMLLFLDSAAVAEPQDIRSLQSQISLRDQTIVELLDRIDNLERRVGVTYKPAPVRNDTPNKHKPLATGPGVIRVTDVEAERALERSLTLEGAILLRAGVVELEPGIVFSREEDVSPVFYPQGDELFPGERKLALSGMTSYFSSRIGLPWDSEISLALPYRVSLTEVETRVNFSVMEAEKTFGRSYGDLSLGVAKAIWREGLWRPNLIARLLWDSDSGESPGFHELRTTVTGTKRLDPVTAIGSFAYQYVFERESFRPGSSLSGSVGALVALSPEISMRFLFNGDYQFEAMNSQGILPGSNRLLNTFSIGGSGLIAPGLMLNMALSIGLTKEANDFALTVSLPLRIH